MTDVDDDAVAYFSAYRLMGPRWVKKDPKRMLGMLVKASLK